MIQHKALVYVESYVESAEMADFREWRGRFAETLEGRGRYTILYIPICFPLESVNCRSVASPALPDKKETP